MAGQNEFVNYLLELLAGMQGVRARAMFGGHGIYLNDVMFGLVADDQLYLKTGPEIDAWFDELELPHFNYDKKGKLMQISYRLVPESALDDPDEMQEWAQRSYEEAVRLKK